MVSTGSGVDLLTPERVRAAAGDCRFGQVVHHRSTVDSTNELARALGRQGEVDGAVVIADEQTAGRGRRRRRWVSPAGAGLYLSVILRPPFPASESGSAVQLAAGIAVAEAVQRSVSSPVVLRWPNDCYVDDRKIAGVLVEAETTGAGLDFLVCGIGVNVNHDERDFPAQLRDRATSVRMLLGHAVARLPLLGELLRSLDTWEAAWRRHGLTPIRERWLELSPESSGGRVEVQTDSGLLSGRAVGLSDDGRLRVEDDGTVHEIRVGEVVRMRPA